jgi:polysaccharide biosynthesis/export protein
MAKTIARLVSISILLLAFSAIGNAQGTVNPGPRTAPPLKIGSGDLIEVTMFGDPDLSGHFRVDENGDIAVPLLGRVHVAGLTAEGAAKLIERRYVEAQILQPAESQATVFISEYATQGIVVNGEVKTPGVYPALGVRTLNDVITAAGGVTTTASSKVIITHRNAPKSPMTVEYNPEALHPILPDVQVFPGDTVMVPRAGIVYVLGNVNKPGQYVLEGRQSLTVEEIMALAGGTGHAAATKRVQLVRTLEGGRKEAITIPLNLIYKGKAPDVALKDGDILFVPTGTGKLAAEQALASAVSIGTQIAVFKVGVY